MRILVGITGASGAAYARRLLTALDALEIETHCAISESARTTWRWELGEEFEAFLPATRGVSRHGSTDLMSPMASGSFRHDGMAIVPCSMNTLASLASGQTSNLIQRAADVCLKERRPLILVPRESPYSLIHLENMTRVTRAGAVVLPASPGFYHRPATIDGLVDFVVSRVLDQLGIPNSLVRRWGDDRQEAGSDGRESRDR